MDGTKSRLRRPAGSHAAPARTAPLAGPAWQPPRATPAPASGWRPRARDGGNAVPVQWRSRNKVSTRRALWASGRCCRGSKRTSRLLLARLVRFLNAAHTQQLRAPGLVEKKKPPRPSGQVLWRPLLASSSKPFILASLEVTAPLPPPLVVRFHFRLFLLGLVPLF